MQAKTILDRKGVTYSEFIIDYDDESREVMLKRSGGRDSVPQIFINGRSIGGSEALEALNLSGQLDALLSERPRDFVNEDNEATRAAANEAGRSSGGRWNLFSRFRRP
jgi:glutaredoxin 3